MVEKDEKEKKIIVIGIDGASWNVILPLIYKNKLSTIKKINK